VKGLRGQDLQGAAEVFLENRRLRGDLIAVCNFLRRGSGGRDADLLSLVTSDRT